MSSKTFVLVHGAWGSAKVWSLVANRLKSLGHTVAMTSHTGQGERAHLATPDITLETHILDITNLILYHDLDDIYLVGHSYGGMVITGVWDRVRERIRHVVYLDAFVPEDGKRLFDYIPPHMQELRKKQAEENDGMMPAPASNNRKYPSFPQSARTFLEPLTLTRGALPQDTPKTYILATENNPSPFHQFGAKIKHDSAWHYHEVATGHRVMDEQPDWLTELLHGLEQ